MRKAGGIGVYAEGMPYDDQEPIEVTHEELLALRAFNYVRFDERAPGRFVLSPRDNVHGVSRFLKQLRGGRAP